MRGSSARESAMVPAMRRRHVRIPQGWLRRAGATRCDVPQHEKTRRRSRQRPRRRREAVEAVACPRNRRRPASTTNSSAKRPQHSPTATSNTMLLDPIALLAQTRRMRARGACAPGRAARAEARRCARASRARAASVALALAVTRRPSGGSSTGRRRSRPRRRRRSPATDCRARNRRSTRAAALARSRAWSCSSCSLAWPTAACASTCERRSRAFSPVSWAALLEQALRFRESVTKSLTGDLIARALRCSWMSPCSIARDAGRTASRRRGRFPP